MSKKWSSYQHVGRTNTVIPTASLAGTEVSVEEIRSAASFSDHYPPSIHAPLISSPEPDPQRRIDSCFNIRNLILLFGFSIVSFNCLFVYFAEQAIVYQGGYYGGDYGGNVNEYRR